MPDEFHACANCSALVRTGSAKGALLSEVRYDLDPSPLDPLPLYLAAPTPGYRKLDGSGVYHSSVSRPPSVQPRNDVAVFLPSVSIVIKQESTAPCPSEVYRPPSIRLFRRPLSPSHDSAFRLAIYRSVRLNRRLPITLSRKFLSARWLQAGRSESVVKITLRAFSERRRRRRSPSAAALCLLSALRATTHVWTSDFISQ